MISWLLVKCFLIIKLEETRFRITQWTNVLNVSSYYITKIGLLDKYKSNWKGKKHKTSNGPKACYFKWTSFHKYTTLVLNQSWEKTRWHVQNPTIELLCACSSKCSTGIWLSICNIRTIIFRYYSSFKEEKYCSN